MYSLHSDDKDDRHIFWGLKLAIWYFLGKAIKRIRLVFVRV